MWRSGNYIFKRRRWKRQLPIFHSPLAHKIAWSIKVPVEGVSYVCRLDRLQLSVTVSFGLQAFFCVCFNIPHRFSLEGHPLQKLLKAKLPPLFRQLRFLPELCFARTYNL